MIVEEFGKENKKTIVMLHGANFIHSFGRQYSLAKEYHILVPHIMGFGDNTKKIFQTDECIEELADYIKSLNKNPSKYADEVIALDRTFEAMTKEVIVRSIPLTNIVYKEDSNFKTEINNILTILGVPNPSEEFYR